MRMAAPQWWPTSVPNTASGGANVAAKEQTWIPEKHRPFLDDMTSTQIWDELMLDVKMNHATDITRFNFAIAVLASKKARTRKKISAAAEAIFLELQTAAKEMNGYGLPGRSPDAIFSKLMNTGEI